MKTVNYIHNNKRGAIEIRVDGFKWGEIVAVIDIHGIAYEAWQGSTRKGSIFNKREFSLDHLKLKVSNLIINGAK